MPRKSSKTRKADEAEVSPDAPAPLTPAEPVADAADAKPVAAPHSWPKGLLLRCKRCVGFYGAHWKLAIPATAIVVIAAAGIVPWTRYELLGLVVSEELTVAVVDSRAGTPVSNASVTIDGHTAVTGANGTAHLRTSVGYHMLAIAKQYYASYGHSQLVDLSAGRGRLTVRLTALGRLVPVRVTNKLTGESVAGATVKALNATAITDTHGAATIVLPANDASQPATVSAPGYNVLQQSITITDRNVPANSFAITPAGKIYFLSNLSGKIDVVKTNLDGSDRETVLAGTGYEDQYSTVLLASRDWKYLALYAQRKATGGAEIDLISTADVLDAVCRRQKQPACR